MAPEQHDELLKDVDSQATSQISNESTLKKMATRLRSYLENAARFDAGTLPTPPPTPSQLSVTSSRQSAEASENGSVSVQSTPSLRRIRSDQFLGAHPSFLGKNDSAFGRSILDNEVTPSKPKSLYSTHTPSISSDGSRRKPSSGTRKSRTCYPGPSRLPEKDEQSSRSSNNITHLCSSCGLQLWQCANASNFTGSEWKKVPRFSVRVEQHDHARLLRYYKERLEAQKAGGADRSGKKIKLCVLPRRGHLDKPVEVRIDLKHRDKKASDSGAAVGGLEQVEVLICEGKIVELARHMRQQVQSMHLAGTAPVSLINKAGQFRVDALLIKRVQ